MYAFAFCHTFLSRQLTERARSSRRYRDLWVIQYLFPGAAEVELFVGVSGELAYS